MNHPKVSIIVLIQNVESVLRPSLETIFNCDIKDFECILIDNDSYDSSKDICLEFQNKYKNVSYIKLTKSTNANAINVGISCAKGEYLYFINGKDFLCKNFINDAISFMDLQENKNTDIYIRNYKILENNQKFLFSSFFLNLKIGPILSQCVLRKSCINIECIDEPGCDVIFLGKIMYSSNNFYVDKSFDSFILNKDLKENNIEYEINLEKTCMNWTEYCTEQIEEYCNNNN